MTVDYRKKSSGSEETLRDILLLFIWGAVLCLCAITLKNQYLSGQPPLWDNLSYQQQTLQFLTNCLEGNWTEALNEIWASMTPAYLISLATSYILFGLNPVSPYIVSAFFGVACMVAVYLLSQELGASKRTAFWGTVTFSLLPNFIYQNFLQTRNDFPLAFFITISWFLLLRGIQHKDFKSAFCAGAIAGVGTLFKASAPGYIAWGVLAFLAIPEKHIHINLKNRMKLALFFIGGATLSCGWHFLPHLSQILTYYTIWGNFKTWVAPQYNLQSNWVDFFFYLRNIIFNHLGKKVSIGIILVVGVLLMRWFKVKRSIKLPEENSKESPLVFLVLMAGILPIIFISLKGSFSSLGDIPALPLLATAGIAFIYKISKGIVIPRIFLAPLLPIGLIISLANLNIIEKQFSAKDIEILSRETMNVRQEFGLGNTRMMQVFSHPIYNTDSLAWFWLMDPKIDRDLVHQHPHSLKLTAENHLLYPEDGKIIASKLEKFPLLILSEFPGTIIQGEKFNTLNRLHSKINSALAKQGQFLKVRSLDLEGGRFPVHFMLNKNFSVRLK